ncbi:MAG: hypothetical protein HY735_03935 [Verrucomicrobia bacterium]|nr:hypothetical protein [Verrucomicrobiota bacterium]
MPEKLRHAHQFVRLVRLLHHRVLAVSLHSRSSRRPNEVRPPNARIPKITETGGNTLSHLLQNGVVPPRTRHRIPLLAYEPDRRRKRCR